MSDTNSQPEGVSTDDVIWCYRHLLGREPDSDISQPERRHRLGMLQGLSLAFLIHRQRQSVLGRIQIQPNYVVQFFDEERIGGESEALGKVGFDRRRAES